MVFLLTLFLFIGIVSVTLLLFGGVFAFTTVKSVGRMLGGVLAPGVGGPRLASGGRVCGNPECRQGNPPGARFCRRCGRPIA